MKILVLPLLALSCVWGEEALPSLLSPEKQALIKHTREGYEFEYEKLRTDWISPIGFNALYHYDKSAQGDFHSDTAELSVSLGQDLFRSGGITSQINYARTKKELEALRLHQQIGGYHEQLFSALLTYRKNTILKRQSLLRLKNKEIEIFIKRQLYDAGKADITELNNAFVEQSAEQKNLASLNARLAEERYEIAKISDIDPDTFVVNPFEPIDQERYVAGTYDLLSARFSRDTLKHQSDIARSRYLPTLSLDADVGYRRYDPKEVGVGYDGHFYGAGVRLSLPLSYSGEASAQEARAEYLKESAKAADQQRLTQGYYRQRIEKIKSHQEMIEITRRNLLLYDEVIRAVEAGVNAGTKTGYDLQMLTNTRALEELELSLNDLEIQLLLAQLHFDLHASKEPL
jgi:outer membrane protein